MIYICAMKIGSYKIEKTSNPFINILSILFKVHKKESPNKNEDLIVTQYISNLKFVYIEDDALEYFFKDLLGDVDYNKN